MPSGSGYQAEALNGSTDGMADGFLFWIEMVGWINGWLVGGFE